MNIGAKTNVDPKVEEVVICLEKLGFGCFYNFPQIPIKKLGYDNAKSNLHLEIDIVAIYQNVGLFIEVTTKKKNNRAKLERFQKNLNIFLKSPKRKQALALNIPKKYFDDYESICHIRKVFIGFSHELVLDPLSYQDIPPANDMNLYVFNSEDFEYIKLLSKTIESYGVYELLDKLAIPLSQINHFFNGTRIYDCILASNRRLSLQTGMVDLYAFTAPIYDLLLLSKVFRYGALGLSTTLKGYQRVLIVKKLRNIREKIKSLGNRMIFPNAIVAIIRDDVEYKKEEKKIVIPAEHGALEIIDGQHRLFAFSQSEIETEDLKDMRLFVIGVRFHQIEEPEIKKKFSAETFVEINRNQTKVPTHLIYLIEYDVLNKISPESIAGKVVADINIDKGHILSNLFATRPLMRKNRLDKKPISVTTIIAELSKLFKIDDNCAKQIFGNKAWSQFKAGVKCPELISKTKQLLGIYFTKISIVFKQDWSSSESYIFSAKYIAAFIRLMINYLKKHNNLQNIDVYLNGIKKNVESKLNTYRPKRGPNGEFFHKTVWKAPPLKSHLSVIFDFLSS